MSQLDSRFLFSSNNKLDRNTIMYIFEFLHRNEIKLLSSLIFSTSEEIENEFYNETLIDHLGFGKCLAIYSWDNTYWKDEMLQIIDRFNETMKNVKEMISIGKEVKEIKIEDDCNYRSCFLKQVWEMIDLKHWKFIQHKRFLRKLYIISIPFKIREIAQQNIKFRNEECEIKINRRLEHEIFIEDSHVERIISNNEIILTNEYYLKWVLVGSSKVGKTSICIKAVIDKFFEFPTRTMPGTHKRVYLPTLQERVLERRDYCDISYWDTVGSEEYDDNRPGSYHSTHVFGLVYSVIDFSSLEEIIEKFIWECVHVSSDGAFVLVSTKNDLRQEYYWASLFDSSIEEPISAEDGVEFAKALGAISHIATCSKTGKGVKNIEKKLFLLFHFYANFKLKCEAQTKANWESSQTLFNFSLIDQP